MGRNVYKCPVVCRPVFDANAWDVQLGQQDQVLSIEFGNPEEDEFDPVTQVSSV